MGVPLIGRTWFLNSFNRPLLCCRDICVLDKSLAQESRSFLASTQVVVRLEVEFPSGHFAWGCGVLEDKSLHIDPASTLPLVRIVPWKRQCSLCSALLSISCLPQPLQHLSTSYAFASIIILPGYMVSHTSGCFRAAS